MARSSYIYVIKHNTGHGIVACFTVKHEAISFLENILKDLKVFYLMRYVDSPNQIDNGTLISGSMLNDS